MEKLDHATYFQTHVYAVKKPEFLESVREVSDRYLAEVRQEKQMTEQPTAMEAIERALTGNSEAGLTRSLLGSGSPPSRG